MLDWFQIGLGAGGIGTNRGGGGVLAKSCSLSINNSLFENNNSTNYGNHCFFFVCAMWNPKKNKKKQYTKGGGVSATKGSVVVIHGSTMLRNHAAIYGGGLCAYGELGLYESIFDKNTANVICFFFWVFFLFNLYVCVWVYL